MTSTVLGQELVTYFSNGYAHRFEVARGAGLPLTPQGAYARILDTRLLGSWGDELSDLYQEWNNAIASVLFGEGFAGIPAYLDLDAEDLVRVGSALSVSVEDPRASLVDAVRETLVWVEGSATSTLFDRHLQELRRWRVRLRQDAQTAGAPPVLGLLAVFVLAAEESGALANSTTSYYHSLHRLLVNNASAEQKRSVELSYRTSAEELWDGLELWLNTHGGALGLPTAFALTFRYVGLPMSQALVRQADRRKLPRFFATYKLIPGAAMAPGDIEVLFDEWIRQNPCPVSVSLQQLWARADARPHIADVIAQELISWTGNVLGQGIVEGQTFESDLHLIARVARGLRPRLELTLALAVGLRDSVTLQTIAMPPIDIVFTPSPGRFHIMAAGEITEIGAVLEGVVTLKSSTHTSDFKRVPRRVVPMPYDDMQGAFVESERLQLAQDALLLVHDTGTTVQEVHKILDVTCRPGFVRHPNDFAGVPKGWVLFSGVEVLTKPDEALAKKYNELVPISSTLLNFAGGLKLPGRLQKWSSRRVPEVRAVSQSGKHIRVELWQKEDFELRTDQVKLDSWESDGGVVFADLSELDLHDGDYLLRMFEAGSKEPVQQRELRLRSSDSRDEVAWMQAKRLWYDFTENPGRAILSATEALNAKSTRVDGVLVTHCGEKSPVSASPLPPNFPHWKQPAEKSSALAVNLSVQPADPKSCVNTGAHYIELPPAPKGRPSNPYIQGRCKYCGLTRRYPAWHKRYGQKPVQARTGPAIAVNVRDLPAAKHLDQDGWQDALDGLMHVGGGKATWLERIADQVTSSAIERADFLRELQECGHVNLQFDELGHLEFWEISPRVLAQTSDDRFALAGHWPVAAQNQLQALAEEAGGEFSSGSGTRLLPMLRMRDVSLVPIVASEVDADIQTATAEEMLSVLPSLSEVLDSAPRAPLPGGQRIERFEVESARWMLVSNLSNTGAFRVHASSGRVCVVRTAEDLILGTARVVDSSLAKHLAALQEGRLLMAYLSESKEVVVPLGARLPGLYGRALAMCAGGSPAAKSVSIGTQKMPVHSYERVDTGIAARLRELFER